VIGFHQKVTQNTKKAVRKRLQVIQKGEVGVIPLGGQSHTRKDRQNRGQGAGKVVVGQERTLTEILQSQKKLRHF